MMKTSIPIRLLSKLLFLFSLVWLTAAFLASFLEKDFSLSNLIWFYLLSVASFLLVSFFAFQPLKRAIRYFELLLGQPKSENLRVEDEAFNKVFRQGEWEDFGDLVRKLERKLRRRTKALLREKTELMAVLDSLNSPIVAVNSRMEVAFLNSAFAVLFDLSTKKVIKEDAEVRNLEEIVLDSRIIKIFEKALNSEDFDKKMVAIDLGQRRRLYSISMSPLRRGVDHSLYGVVASFNDETLKVELDQKRMDFVSNASHELRTPITAVYTSVNLLDKVEDEESKKQIMESLETNSKRLVNLTQDLLDLSKLEGDQEELDCSHIELKKLTEEVLKSLPDQEAGRVQTCYEADAGYFDESKVKQVMTNLIKNALIYSPEEKEVQVLWTLNEEGLLLSVKDQGPGIPESDSKRIFERFYRVDKSRSRKSGGSGIGLSIVKHIMSLHEGEVKLMPYQEGQGAEFRCVFPELETRSI